MGGGAVFRKVYDARCTGSAVRFACARLTHGAAASTCQCAYSHRTVLTSWLAEAPSGSAAPVRGRNERDPRQPTAKPMGAPPLYT